MDWSDQPGDLAVGNGKAFVSNGERIVVADTDGELVDTITGLSDAYGLAMAPRAAPRSAPWASRSHLSRPSAGTGKKRNARR
ncbi:hypothetical protein E1295_38060 [Nonomuraea mesophila]|uniref:Uncharacterized protein n=1 Tax=Nonomuraea mesophila TaxID=2530382 RepID=A0A4R5EGI2_9ACTN|nr:hypothetical protein [Nonomuraea mesophila]TDE33525.1 hypothetical protein E1295_38060 [Nonomuraea mesophila]